MYNYRKSRKPEKNTGKTGKQDESNNKSVINDWGKGGKVVGLNKIKK